MKVRLATSLVDNCYCVWPLTNVQSHARFSVNIGVWPTTDDSPLSPDLPWIDMGAVMTLFVANAKHIRIEGRKNGFIGESDQLGRGKSSNLQRRISACNWDRVLVLHILI